MTGSTDTELDFETFGPEGAPTVVLVHGAPDRAVSFRAALPYLSSVRVVLYDRRGYGRSVEARPATSMHDHAEDLLDVMERCGSPCVVVAHSFGSNPTMLAASLRPEAFAAMGVWEPPLPWVDWWAQSTRDYNAAAAVSDDPEGTIEEMYRRILGDETWHGLSPEVQAQRRAEGRAFQTDMASQIVAPFEFDQVKVPTLVGYGTDTSGDHTRGAPWLAERLPDARLHVIPGAGHFANRTHPEEFAQFIHAVVARAEIPA